MTGPRLLLFDPDEDRSWFADAACKGVDPNLFHPYKGESIAKAKVVCDTCPVRQTCLDWAITHKSAGVWGGTSGLERRQMRYPQAHPQARRRRSNERLTDDQVRDIRRRTDAGELQSLIAADYGVTRDCVSKIVTRRNYWRVA